MATQLARQFVMASNRTCSACYKAIATEAVYCSGCASFFHPGCVKKRVQQTDTARCCPGIAFEFLAQGAEPLAAFSSGTSSTPGSCPPAELNSRSSLSACPPSQSTSGTSDPISNTDLLRLLSARLDDIASRISGLPAMQEHIDMNTARIANLEDQNRLLREGVSNLKRLHEVEQRERQKTSVKLCEADIIISGAPCPANRSLNEIVKNVASVIGVNLTDADILASRFLVTQSQVRKKDYPVPILTKLRSRELAVSIMSARKAKGTLYSSELEGTVNSLSTVVHIKEALPGELYRLLLSVKSTAKTLGFKYVWQRNGAILLRKSDGANVIRIRSVADLEAFKTQFSCGNRVDVASGSVTASSSASQLITNDHSS
ncbi:hypothetical protein KPH14_000890 [Odynerus spinipes]|uniref:FP protein C-terminal domain-containing protein n=1 Tax=Odynerus spinipes TaxID=1348599 RepID=A0AAD9VI29_9HYME|nr:hypothetical protein KPH14_000890 [Odynerus spinipes]